MAHNNTRILQKKKNFAQIHKKYWVWLHKETKEQINAKPKPQNNTKIPTSIYTSQQFHQLHPLMLWKLHPRHLAAHVKILPIDSISTHYRYIYQVLYKAVSHRCPPCIVLSQTAGKVPIFGTNGLP